MKTPSSLRNALLIFALAVALSTTVPGADAASYIVSTSEANSRLYQVNAATGGSTLIGSTGIGFLSDIAISNSGALFGTNGSDLYSINPNTAASSLVGSISGVTFLEGLDFDSSGTLWGVDVGTNEVWTINTTTAAGNLEFGTGVPWNGDIAHQAGDIFYANGPFLANNNLWELDTNAQTFADRGTMVSGVSFTALDFDNNGDLFAFTSGGDIYEIQNFATSATGVFSASSSVTQISGATFLVPEPSRALLAALGIGVMAWKRRRRR